MKMFKYLYLFIFISACIGTAIAIASDNPFLLGLCPATAIGFGFYTAFLYFSDDANGLTSEPDLGKKSRTDMPATRQWVEQQLNAKTSNFITPQGITVTHLQSQIEHIRASGHHAWFHVCKNGEMVGYIMWGHFEGNMDSDQKGSAYKDVEGVYAFIGGCNGRIGEHVAEILTPSAEALEEFKELTRQAESDYETSGGRVFWAAPSKYLRIGKADAYRLLASLPAPGKI